MAKLTVAQLAEELDILVSQVVRIGRDLGANVENGSSAVDKETAEAIREYAADAGDELLTLHLNPGLNVRDLAALLEVAPQEIQKKLMSSGQLVGLTQALKPEIAEKIVSDYGFVPAWGEPEKKAAEPKPAKQQKSKKTKTPTGAQTRPPIVTILGHVDHGKTSLLDYIRKATVAEGEHGGITQHIGAYQAEVAGRRITFLDTPGHEAFTKMRARGAQVTDIAVLVVAADDGVMPQTIEALNHARNAEVEIVVALNKADKPEADIVRVQQQLAEHNLVPREWGGAAEMVPVSAKTGSGVETLLETILLTADIMELQGDPTGTARGTVVEAKMDKARGPVATVLVQDGTLKMGDAIAVGGAYGKIKAMLDYSGQRITSAGPATPVEILGLSQVPNPGDTVTVFQDERRARAAAEDALEGIRSEKFQVAPNRISLQDLYRQLSEGEVKELNVVLKADVGGSAEAVREQLAQMKNEEVTLKVINAAVGNVNESDVDFASAANAIVVGFNVKIEPAAKALAERQGVEVRSYNIIYELLDDVEKAMKGMLEPKFEEVYLGTAQVRQVFKLTRAGIIAGSYVTNGKIQRNASARLRRGGEVIYEGKIATLKHFKEDVREMATGFECGIGLDNYDAIKEGDEIEAFEVRQVNP